MTGFNTQHSKVSIFTCLVCTERVGGCRHLHTPRRAGCLCSRRHVHRVTKQTVPPPDKTNDPGGERAAVDAHAHLDKQIRGSGEGRIENKPMQLSSAHAYEHYDVYLCTFDCHPRLGCFFADDTEVKPRPSLHAPALVARGHPVGAPWPPLHAPASQTYLDASDPIWDRHIKAVENTAVTVWTSNRTM